MSEKVYMDKSVWVGIMDAIRPKLFSNKQYVAGEVAGLINMLESPVIPPNLPNDGKIRIGYSLPETAPNKEAKIMYYSDSSSRRVTFDWGDGSALESASGSGYITRSHIYTAGGNYTITADVSSGTIQFGGNSTSRTIYAGYTENAYQRGRIQWIVLGNSATLSDSAFYWASGLKKAVLPSALANIGASGMNSCFSLLEIEIPQNVTTIGASAFSGCYRLQRIRFNSGTPPTVANSNAFGGLPVDCVISVPQGARTAYLEAANYPNSANYTYVEE